MIASLLLAVAAAQDFAPPPPPPLVPTPRLVQPRFAPFLLPAELRVVAAEAGLEDEAAVLADLVARRTNITVTLGAPPAKSGDVLLTRGYIADEVAASSEAYSIEVFDDHAAISGATDAGIARGVARFVQLLSRADEHWMLPPVRIDDAPRTEWRGLMLDLARFPHSADDVVDAIEMAYLASLNVVQLHLSDDQAFTFPTELLPPRTDASQPGEHRGYTRAEVDRIVAFARARSITLVPEIDMPAHSRALVNARPDLFGTQDAETGEWRSVGLVNVASEAAIDAAGDLLEEVAAAFPDSPWIHVGGDEFWGPHLLQLPEFAAFAAKHDIETDVNEGAVDALLVHFLTRVTRRVLEMERLPVVWEGFRNASGPPLPDDVLVMSWSQHSMPPDALIGRGHAIVNCGWDPLYVVPAQGWAASRAAAFDWSPSVVRQRFGGRATRLPDDAPVKGAQICVWEQRPDAIVPAVSRILPELTERMWNGGGEGAHAEFDASPLRSMLGDVLRPVRFAARTTDRGGLVADGTVFRGELALEMSSEASGVVRFEVGESPRPVTTGSAAYDGEPLKLADSAYVSARLFTHGGEAIGGTTVTRFVRAAPIWRAEVFDDSADLADDDDRAARRYGSGLLVRPDAARIGEINRELFARVNPTAHVDTRVLAWTEIDRPRDIDPWRPRVWGRHRVHARGTIAIPESGEWTIACRSNDGRTTIRMGGTVVASSERGRRTTRTGTLEAGTYAIEFEHVVTGVHDELQVWLDGPGGREKVPLTDLVLDLDDERTREDTLTLTGFGD